MNYNRLLRRRGKVIRRTPVNALHPQHGWGQYETTRRDEPNFRAPVRYDPTEGVWRYI